MLIKICNISAGAGGTWDTRGSVIKPYESYPAHPVFWSGVERTDASLCGAASRRIRGRRTTTVQPPCARRARPVLRSRPTSANSPRRHLNNVAFSSASPRDIVRWLLASATSCSPGSMPPAFVTAERDLRVIRLAWEILVIKSKCVFFRKPVKGFVLSYFQAT